jgi:hypothetical protein
VLVFSVVKYTEEGYQDSAGFHRGRRPPPLEGPIMYTR